MKLSSVKKLFGGKPPPESRLVAITSERTGERTLLGVENLLSSIAVPEPFSLEIAGDAYGVTLLARAGRVPSSSSSWAPTIPRPG